MTRFMAVARESQTPQRNTGLEHGVEGSLLLRKNKYEITTEYPLFFTRELAEYFCLVFLVREMSLEMRSSTVCADAVDALLESLTRVVVEHRTRHTQSALASRLTRLLDTQKVCTLAKTPMQRMRECRAALSHLDTCGWNRSFHQRQFHEDFLKACTRTFWKLEPPGSFAKMHQKVLQENSWEHLAQEVLISTPRRFGKTISVSMFAAAMLFAALAVELSIYSTCKRISQKLLRGVVKFFYEICQQDLKKHNFHVRRQNMEEIVLCGPEGERDVRIVNSYPSKVWCPPFSVIYRMLHVTATHTTASVA